MLSGPSEIPQVADELLHARLVIKSLAFPKSSFRGKQSLRRAEDVILINHGSRPVIAVVPCASP